MGISYSEMMGWLQTHMIFSVVKAANGYICRSQESGEVGVGLDDEGGGWP